MDQSPNLGQSSWKPSISMSKPRMVKTRKSGSMKARPPSLSSDRAEKTEENLSGWNPFEPLAPGSAGANLSRNSSWRSTDSGGGLSFSFGSEGTGFVFGSGGDGAKNVRNLSRNSSFGSEEMERLSAGKGGDFGERVFVFGSSVEDSTERFNVREMSGGSGENGSGDFEQADADVFVFGSSLKESSEKMEKSNTGSGDNANDASAAVGGFVFRSSMNDCLEKMEKLNIREDSLGSGGNAGGASAVDAGWFAFGSNMNGSLEKMEKLNTRETSAGSRDSAEEGVFVLGSSTKTSSDTIQPSVPHSEFMDHKESKEGVDVGTGFAFGKTMVNTSHDDLEKLKIGSQTEKSAGAVPFKFTFQAGKQDDSSSTGSIRPSQATDTPSFHPPNEDNMGNHGGSGTPNVVLRTPDQDASRLTRETGRKEQVDVVNECVSGTDETVTASFVGSSAKTVGDNMSKPKIGSKVESAVGSTPLKFSFGAGELGQSSSMGSVPPFQATATPPFYPPPSGPSFQQVGSQFTFTSQHGGLEAQHMEFKTPKQDYSWLTPENLFSSQSQNIEFSLKGRDGRSTKSKKKKGKSRQPASYHYSFANQFIPTEGGFQENPETERTDVYSPMDCSPYPEETVTDQFSREASVASADTRRSVSVEREEVLVSAAEKLNVNEGNDMNFGEVHDNGSKDHAQRCSASASSFEDERTFGYGKESDMPRYESMGFDADTRTAPMEAETGSLGSNFEGQSSAGETGFVFSMNVQDFDQSKLPTSSSFVQGPLSAQNRNHRRRSKTDSDQDSFLSTPNSSVTFASPTTNIFPPTSTSMALSSGVEQKDISFVSQSKDGKKTEKSEGPEASQDSKTMTASSVAAQEVCEKWRCRGNQAYSNGNLSKAEDYYTIGIDSVSLKETAGSCIQPLTLCYSNRAATRMSLGRMREAIGDCMVALSIDPNFLRAQVRAANCYLSLGEIGEALKAFKKCLQAHDINSNQKIVTEASDGLQKAQKVADLTGQCAELLLKRTSNDATKALHIISEALVLSPLSESLMEMKAEALLMMRKYEEVIRFCEETLDLAEKNSAVPEADSQLKDVVSSELLKSSSATRWRWHIISKSYFYLGKLEEALELLQKQENLKPAVDKYGNRSSDSSTSLALTVHELLRLKAAGNEAFQAARHSDAVECYTAALVCNAESRPFAAVCFCNRAAAYQALGQIADAIADCSLAIALDASYLKAISRRATLHEIIRDYGQAANDLNRLISLLEKQSEEKDNQSGTSEKSIGNSSDLKKARMRLASVEEEARKGRSLDLYMILGVEPSSSAADVKKAYRKAALRHHPDKAGQFLVRNENVDDELWREVANEVHTDAERLFKMIGKSYTILSDPTKRQQYDAEEEMRTNLNKGYNAPSTPRTPADSHSSHFERNTSRRQWREHGSFNQRY